MSQASARRSFHGPLISTLLCGPARAPLVPSSPRVSAMGRAVLRAARQESPSPDQRQRVLAGVLSALQRLTAENA